MREVVKNRGDEGGDVIYHFCVESVHGKARAWALDGKGVVWFTLYITCELGTGFVELIDSCPFGLLRALFGRRV